MICARPHVILWIVFMVLYTIILGLIPCTWISVIWDQIIDPEFDLEHIEQPENRIIKMFYTVSGKINTSVLIRNVVFVVIGVMTMLSSVLDLIVWPPCMLENPRVILTSAILSLYQKASILTSNFTELHVQMRPGHHGLLHLHQDAAHLQVDHGGHLPPLLLPYHLRVYWQASHAAEPQDILRGRYIVWIIRETCLFQ